MPKYLGEDQVGDDPAEIAYPGLLICMGVTVLMDDGHLIGAHVTNGTTEAGVLAELLNQITAHGGAMQQLYCTGHKPLHRQQKGGTVQDKAQALGFHGDAYLFDTSPVKSKEGTYVAIRTNGADHKCGVYYKREVKARNFYATDGTPVPVVQFSEYRGIIPADTLVTHLSGDITNLHQASHLLQVKHYRIP